MDEKKTSLKARKTSLFKKLLALSVLGSAFSLYYLSEPSNSHVENELMRSGSGIFPSGSSLTEEVLKETYLKALETNYAGNWSEKYTSEPHLPGTNYGFVEWTARKFEEYGLKSEVDTYDIYVSYPHEHSLKLLSSEDELVYEAPLKEDELEEDPTSVGDDLVPTFLAYAANGNVTAEFVYCNYGTKGDFDLLKANGVDVTGKIAIIRYGSIFRGLKVKFAQENGAVGVLLYSDPGDDFGITPENGYDTYPNGPARNPSSVQRGSVQFLSARPGDPTTPGYASKPGVPRADPHDSIGKIPVLPISYKEVKPILTKLNGYGKSAEKIGGEGWVGELSNFSYSLGPNPEYKLNLYSDQIYNITPLWNVYGTIPGKNPKEVIIIGNHRDAWIKGGAGDPNSGSAVILEIARGFNELTKLGWKPERTIIFASWDGEEYLLLGSTEFGENFAKQLQLKVVAYLNLDVACIGSRLEMGASPVLNSLLRSVAKKLPYPKGGTLYSHFVEKANDKIHNLGSGSDYTVFLERLGIPSVDMSFTVDVHDAVYQYHSNYDSFYWMSRFGDPGFVYHNLMAKYLGLIALELSEKKLIDFKIKDYATELQNYYQSTIASIPDDWTDKPASFAGFFEHFQNNKFIEEITDSNYKSEVKCNAKTSKKTKKHHHHHHGNFTLSKLTNKVSKQLEDLILVAALFDDKVSEAQFAYDNSDDLSLWQKLKLRLTIRSLNNKLKFFERNFLFHKGLKDRSWFRHIVFASGRYTGYEGQTLPGLKEAIEDNDIEEAARWLGILMGTIKRVKAGLK